MLSVGGAPATEARRPSAAPAAKSAAAKRPANAAMPMLNMTPGWIASVLPIAATRNCPKYVYERSDPESHGSGGGSVGVR